MTTDTACTKQTALIVLGMHRSGTSALTGALEVLGFRTPRNQIKASEQNPKGFFESRMVARLNDRLLARTGGAWDCWRSRPTPQKWVDDDLDEARQLLRYEFEDAGQLVLKDPRICRLFPFWKTVLAEEGYCVRVAFIFRHPKEVARSLQVRNGFRLMHGMLLWLVHVLQAELDSRGTPRVFLSFHQLLADGALMVPRLGDGLGIPLDNSVIVRQSWGQFLDASLKHQNIPNDDKVLPVFESIQSVFDRWSLQGEDVEGRELLDRIWRSLLRSQVLSTGSGATLEGSYDSLRNLRSPF